MYHYLQINKTIIIVKRIFFAELDNGNSVHIGERKVRGRDRRPRERGRMWIEGILVRNENKRERERERLCEGGRMEITVQI